MSKEIIAVVRLNVGESGYYDELSRIHLTQSNPLREILAGTNCTQLRRSVKSGRLRLLSGSLGEEKKLDLGKKGNRFTGAVAPAFAVEDTTAVSVTESVIDVVPVVEDSVEIKTAPVVGTLAEESGVVDIVVLEKAAEVPKKQLRKLLKKAPEREPAARKKNVPVKV